MRQVRLVWFGVLVALLWATPDHAALAAPPVDSAPPPPTTAPSTIPSTFPALEPPELQVPPPILDPQVVSAPLVVVPAGCQAPPAPVAVFVGVIAAADATTARFAIQQVRAGTLDGYAVGTVVDVRYDDDIRFLRTGQQYLVGAAPDPITGVLSSKVRLAAPLFGGDAVIGVNDTDLACPRVEDGVKTLHVNGAGVDTGVLAPLKTAKRSLLRAVLKPLGIAFVILVCLVAIKLLAFAMVRALRESALDEADLPPPADAQRDRQHYDELIDVDERSVVGVRGEQQ